MRIALLSDTRLPTNLKFPGHGLGRQMARIAIGLAARGHDVTVYAGIGSEVEGCTVVIDANEDQRGYAMAGHDLSDYDAILDGSHHFALAILRPDLPIVCKVADGEGKAPRNRVYGHPNIAGHFGLPESIVISEGVDVENIPFMPGERGKHLLFASAMWPQKKPEVAVEVAQKAGVPIWLMGYGTPLDLPADRQINSKSGADFYAELGSARGMIYPMASMAMLEAAATGTPSICMLGNDIWVLEGVTGYIRTSVESAAEAVALLDGLDRRAMRQWVEDCRSIAVMAKEWEGVLERAANGGTW